MSKEDKDFRDMLADEDKKLFDITSNEDEKFRHIRLCLEENGVDIDIAKTEVPWNYKSSNAKTERFINALFLR